MHELGLVTHVVRTIEEIGREEKLTETIPAVTLCEDCQKTYSTLEYKKICPYCGSENTYLSAGNEFNIKEIAAC